MSPQQNCAEVCVTFTTTAEGGRRSAVSLGNGGYRPHFRVSGGEYLGVEYVVGPQEPVRPGGTALATVSFLYEPTVNYAALTDGANFQVLEGPNVVGNGHIVRRHFSQSRA